MDKRINTYTSTGYKFFLHKQQMENLLKESPNSIISSHISPESRCNLNCEYCSVKKRKQDRIGIKTLNKYLDDVKSLGCKAITITGGGEPTLYPYFDEMIKKIDSLEMEKAIITNGTNLNMLQDYYFKWIRISIWNSDFWIKSIEKFAGKFPIETDIGLSIVYAEKNKNIKKEYLDDLIDKLGAKYVRLIPDCLENNKGIFTQYEEIEKFARYLNNEKVFVQYKKHGTPNFEVCYFGYIRPYLSELNGGTVFPCDSLVLNDNIANFDKKYAICKAKDITKYMKRKIRQRFLPIKDCKGCVYTDNVNLLQDYIKRPDAYVFYKDKEFKHKNFI